MIAIAPSILSADFARLGEQVLEAVRAGVDRVHVDVMDGHFVPNLSMGPIVVHSLRPVTQLPLEVHLMVERPDQFVEPFANAGADTLIVHHEVLPNPRPLLREIRAKGKKAGLAINPNAAIEVLEPFLPEIDLALCMTVFPGFGGQPYIVDSPERIRRLRALIDRINPSCELEVDGGIDWETAKKSVDAGADVLVAGTSIFRAPEGVAAAVQSMRSRIG